jgi:hypothetical protein
MKSLVLDAADAKKFYPTADPAFKKVLESTFGAGHFSNKITDRVKTFEDACNVLGLDADDVLPYDADDIMPYDADDSTEAINAFAKLNAIAKALNEGWTPDWNNSNEYKYWPYFKMQNGFSFDGVVYWCTLSAVGSRLCFKTRELAEYAGKQFLDIYKEWMVIS